MSREEKKRIARFNLTFDEKIRDILLLYFSKEKIGAQDNLTIYRIESSLFIKRI